MDRTRLVAAIPSWASPPSSTGSTERGATRGHEAVVDHDQALLVPEGVDETLHSVTVCVRLVVVAKAAFDKVVHDDLTQLLTLVIREPPLCQSAEERKHGGRPARDDLPKEIRFGSGKPLVHDSMPKTIVTERLTSSARTLPSCRRPARRVPSPRGPRIRPPSPVGWSGGGGGHLRHRRLGRK